MSKETLSLLIQLFGLLVIVLFSLITRKMKLSLWFAAVIMVAIAIVAQFMIAGGGPEGCMSLYAFPMLGCTVAWGTVSLMNQFKRKQ